jgi:tetratricopeptide (TPR) repeat protein
MEEKILLGKYNGIYFLGGNIGIESICDRFYYKQAVRFVEEKLEDLSGLNRHVFEYTMTSMPPTTLNETNSESVTNIKHIEDYTFEFSETEQTLFELGFGRSLQYQPIKSGENTISALLTITLPEQSRYKVLWDTISRYGNRFELPERINLTIFTELDWTYNGSIFIVETLKESEVTFLIESSAEPFDVQDTIIICGAGKEKEAVLARVSCKSGFVPCFIWDKAKDEDGQILCKLISQISHKQILAIYAPIVRDIISEGVQVFEYNYTTNNSIPFSQRLGFQNELSLKVPDSLESYGPALFLALQYGADLYFEDSLENSFQLKNKQNELLADWTFEDLIGLPLAMNSLKGLEGTQKELIICENSTDELLICQAVGYASMQNCEIAFIPAINSYKSAISFENGLIGVTKIEESCRQAVPDSLRSPDTTFITVFTRSLPLHLTPAVKDSDAGYSQTEHWLDRYNVSHLPGHAASQLIPKYYLPSSKITEATFSIIFDTLGDVVESEANIISEYIKASLSNPILLPREVATTNLLRELTKRLATDLILLITHGENNYIEDGNGELITADEISTWTLKGNTIIFNNSCSSWITTGQAFIDAGAQGLIATLWPIGNHIAVSIAAEIGKSLIANQDISIAEILAQALQGIGTEQEDDRLTRLSYFYIGLPRTQLPTKPSIGNIERISSLTQALITINNICDSLALEGQPQLAVTLLNLTRVPLKIRFEQMLVKGTPAMHLSPPFQFISLLDLDYLLASNDFQIGMSILKTTIADYQDEILYWMDEKLNIVIQELLNWNDRHDDHNNDETREQREARSVETGFPFRAMNPGNQYRLFVKATYNFILPFIIYLVKLRHKDRAKVLLRIASILITIPEDLSPGNLVSDEALISRMKRGNPEKFRIYDPGNSNHNEEIEFDLLDQDDISRADLLNHFGIIYLNLEEFERALNFFEAALALCQIGSKDYSNILSNIIKTKLKIESNTVEVKENHFSLLQEYIKITNQQIQNKDYKNAIISMSNFIRFSVEAGEFVQSDLISNAFRWIEFLTDPNDRIDSECNLLAATSCLEASRGNFLGAYEICDTIGHYLNTSNPITSVPLHFNELPLWLYNNELYNEALKQTLKNEKILEQAGFVESQIRTLALACACSTQLCSTGSQRSYINLFLDCSRKFGHALRNNYSIKIKLQKEEELNYLIETILYNTQSVWEQAAQQGNKTLANKAYQCVKAWNPSEINNAWELLEKALHTKNIQAIKALVSSTALVREVIISINTINVKIKASARVVTYRLPITQQRSTLSPSVIYCYCSLGEHLILKSDEDVSFVAQCAVFPLVENKPIVIESDASDFITIDSRGTYHYQEVWGSKIIPYNVLIKLDIGLLPVLLTWNGELKPIANSTIIFHEAGCNLQIVGDQSSTPILPGFGQLKLMFIKDKQLWESLYKTGLLRKEKISLTEYSIMIHLLFRI